VILEKCSRHIDVLDDGHFATVLVGVVDLARHEVTLANAGHLNPLLLSGEDVNYISTEVGVPLGLRNATYESLTVSVLPGSTMIAFTDGLVERRGETLDEGLHRLMESARGVDCPLQELLAKVVADLNDESSEDDIAILGLRWQN
jgi:serine phosphatase RsbU (regulator of sigma subunit)